MASNTENLNLLMKNPSTDGADTFNVQTMLNDNWQKIDNNAGTVAQTLANILKPTTPPIIGLPPSTTPDGMFQALGNTGELHVWKKTITSGTGTYRLGAVQEDLHYIKWANNSATSDSSGTFEYGSEIAVNNDGTITGIKNPSTITIKPWDDDASKANVFKGKFIKMISQVETSMSHFKIGEIWWIPADAVMTKGLLNGESNRWYIAASKRQQVIGVPAGTTTTYPVSTNPNAYQEGDDAKEAGYVVGDVETGTFAMATGNVQYRYASSVFVSDDGTVSLVSPSSTTLSADASSRTIALSMRGKYVKATSSLTNCGVPFSSGSVVFLPENAVVSGTVDIDRYQPVTGYAAIPAGTTIEYLGKLGDKARVQVVSYVGTGTYGKSNPNSLTFDFAPKVVMIRCGGDTKIFDAIYGMRDVTVVLSAGYYVTVEWSKKTLSWYSTKSASEQMNYTGDKYYAVAIG